MAEQLRVLAVDDEPPAKVTFDALAVIVQHRVAVTGAIVQLGDGGGPVLVLHRGRFSV